MLRKYLQRSCDLPLPVVLIIAKSQHKLKCQIMCDVYATHFSTIKNDGSLLLEMHGTGTPLGDPIELGAAFTVLQGTSSIGSLLRMNYMSHNALTTRALALFERNRLVTFVDMSCVAYCVPTRLQIMASKLQATKAPYI